MYIQATFVIRTGVLDFLFHAPEFLFHAPEFLFHAPEFLFHAPDFNTHALLQMSHAIIMFLLSLLSSLWRSHLIYSSLRW